MFSVYKETKHVISNSCSQLEELQLKIPSEYFIPDYQSFKDFENKKMSFSIGLDDRKLI